MGIRDLIKKKDNLGEGDLAYSETLKSLSGPEFTFIRSDTHTQEIIYPPSHPSNGRDQFLNARDSGPSKPRRNLDIFKPRSRASSASSVASSSGPSQLQSPERPQTHRRLSQRLHLSREPSTSDYVPQNLPQINITADPPQQGEDREAYERQWEKRATILASANDATRRSRSPSVSAAADTATAPATTSERKKRRNDVVSSKKIDEDIQEAIRLHEDGQLEQSTKLFGRLADPYGGNNPLSQVLYGLALRHGWGCEPDPERAVTYLSAAASNAALVENQAFQAGVNKGGAAKGELVLAIFELANCFRHGWGIPRDPVAAKQYYETAANLGDTDAMNEVAWCYLEGFGCKKDKFASARYYRLAERNCNKTLGNTWIWKDKYNPTSSTGGKR